MSSVDMAVPSDPPPRPPFGMMEAQDCMQMRHRRVEVNADFPLQRIDAISPVGGLMRIQIRPAETAEVAGIFSVRATVNENTLSVAELADMGITPESVTAMIDAELCAWVAVEGDTVVGFSMIDQEEGSLFAVFVRPSHEGRGVGRSLVNEAEKQLFARHTTCCLETGGTTRAAGFYRRLGWSNEQDVGNGDIRLEKRLPGMSASS